MLPKLDKLNLLIITAHLSFSNYWFKPLFLNGTPKEWSIKFHTSTNEKPESAGYCPVSSVNSAWSFSSLKGPKWIQTTLGSQSNSHEKVKRSCLGSVATSCGKSSICNWCHDVIERKTTSDVIMQTACMLECTASQTLRIERTSLIPNLYMVKCLGLRLYMYTAMCERTRTWC